MHVCMYQQSRCCLLAATQKPAVAAQHTAHEHWAGLVHVQAAALGRHLSRLHPALHSPVYCSTAVRAEHTARIMLQQAQVITIMMQPTTHSCASSIILSIDACGSYLAVSCAGGSSQGKLQQQHACLCDAGQPAYASALW
jgi:hypothetical protein